MRRRRREWRCGDRSSRCLEALEFFGKKKFDLIILDIKLPGINGDEVLMKIREEDPSQYDTVYGMLQMARNNPAMRVIIRRMVLSSMISVRASAAGPSS